jgi:hypothetical protein
MVRIGRGRAERQVVGRFFEAWCDRGLAPRGSERLGLLLLHLFVARAMTALELQVLADCVIEDAHARED